jgi:hypothetical protein
MGRTKAFRPSFVLDSARVVSATLENKGNPSWELPGIGIISALFLLCSFSDQLTLLARKITETAFNLIGTKAGSD